MATRQELDEQKALQDAQIAQKEKQFTDAYNLSQAQLAERQKEKENASAKLAQQAYISKKQTERVMPDVLASQGLARTGYVNTRQGQVNEGYKNQYGAIQDDLTSARAEFARQDASEDLAYQQNKDAIELERQAMALDYRQALTRISSQGTGTSQNNNSQIYQYGASAVEGGMTPDQVDAYVQQYVDAGYMSSKNKGKMVTNLQNYGYTFNTGINQFDIPTPKATPKVTPKTNTNTGKKLQKAIAVGQW